MPRHFRHSHERSWTERKSYPVLGLLFVIAAWTVAALLAFGVSAFVTAAMATVAKVL